MPDSLKSKEQLIAELEAARMRISDLEADEEARKQADASLRTEDALLSAMLRNLPFDFWARDADERMIMQSDESLRLWGDLSGVSMDEAGIPREIVQAWHSSNRRALAGEILVEDKEYVHADDERRMYHSILAPIRDNSAILGILGINIDITESRRAEEALRESEERLRLLVENAGDAIYLADQTGKFLDVNPEACLQTGYSREELLAMRVQDLDVIETPELDAFVTPAKADEKACFETRHRRKDGSIFPVEVRGAFIKKDGQVLRLGFARDISERKNIEESLRFSQQRLRIISENIYDWEYWRGPDGKYIWMSPSCETITGYPPDDFIRNPDDLILKIVHPDDKHIWAEHIEVVNSCQPQHRELDFRIVTRSGETVWLSHTCKPVYNQEGSFVGRQGCNRDITDRKRIEEASGRSEKRFRLLFENAPLPYQSLDERGYFLDVNKKWLETLGYDKEEVVGRWFGDFLGKGFVEHFDRNFPMFKEACLIDGVEFDMITKNGRAIRVAFNGRVQQGPKGEFLRTHCIFTDITERRQTEDAISASLREKEILLREIHHRVKNNLQIISSLLSLQADGLRDPAIRDVLTESRGRVATMALIHEQLYRSQDLNEIDMDAYLRQLLPRLVSTYMGGRDISLRLELAPLALTLDQSIPFGLIVNELVTNALKHGFRGRSRGTVNVSVSSAGGRATVAVKDDGVGLPEGFVIETAATLGLQIVSMLANQLHGRLGVETGAGATFTLTFPHRSRPQ